MLLPTALRKSWIYQLLSLLSVATLRPSEIKFLIGIFTGVPIINFILDWESEIANQSGLQTNSSVFAQKMKAH